VWQTMLFIVLFVIGCSFPYEQSFSYFCDMFVSCLQQQVTQISVDLGPAAVYSTMEFLFCSDTD
jgi:hypothetical protein